MIYLKLLLTSFLWAGCFITGRIVAKDVPPFSVVFLRFFITFICMAFLMRHYEKGFPKIPKGYLLPVLVIGFAGIFLYNTLFIVGLKWVEASRASLIIAMNPVFIAILAWIFLKENISPVKGFGICMSVTGAAIVISKGHFNGLIQSGAGWGEGVLLVAVMLWGVYSLVGRIVLKVLSPIASVTYASIVGLVFLFFPACYEGMLTQMFAYSFLDWISIAYLGVFGTVVAFVWYYDGIQLLGPAKASLFINFVPIFAILQAYFMLNEPLTVSLFVGACFVITGVYITNAAGQFRFNQKRVLDRDRI